MKHYVIALGIYTALILGLQLYNLYHATKKKNAQRRRANHSQTTGINESNVQRSGERVSPANEYDAISIEAYTYEPMPTEVWLAAYEQECFLEELRLNLDDNGIEMYSELDL